MLALFFQFCFSHAQACHAYSFINKQTNRWISRQAFLCHHLPWSWGVTTGFFFCFSSLYSCNPRTAPSAAACASPQGSTSTQGISRSWICLQPTEKYSTERKANYCTEQQNRCPRWSGGHFKEKIILTQDIWVYKSVKEIMQYNK